MSVETLAQALLEAGILDASSVEMRVPRARSGRVLLDNLVGDGLVSESSLVNQLARALSVPRYDPKERSPEPDAMALLDLRSVDELGALPVAVRGGGALLWVAMCDPTDEQIIAEVSRRTGRRVKACLIGPRELGRALSQLAGVVTGSMPAPGTQTGTYRAAPQQPSMPSMPSIPSMQALPYGSMPGMMPNGMAMPGMPPQYAFGYPGHVPTQPMIGQMSAPVPGVGSVAGLGPAAPQPGSALPKSADVQKLEDELAQAKQVVKVLAQLLVERGVIDGEELKRRLRAERERK